MFCSREKKIYLWKENENKVLLENRCARHFLGALCFCDASTCFRNPYIVLSLGREVVIFDPNLTFISEIESKPRGLFSLDSLLLGSAKNICLQHFSGA